MSEYKLYTATLDYLATGEGQTLGFYALGATSKEDAAERMIKRGVNAYFLSGAYFYEGMPEGEGAYISDFLLSEKVKSWLEEKAKDLDGNVWVGFTHHVNYS